MLARIQNFYLNNPAESRSETTVVLQFVYRLGLMFVVVFLIIYT